ncbi:MAG: tRNA lysidine(34) synthetase TilS [Ignavibacteriae bacterium HGW-Ignavibacteriae-3]|nr:MAG: tRNA lysidine(34) synthetase TilS [Ignavibacteriae bacterium HGW-Ignavibacteriae-3]
MKKTEEKVFKFIDRNALISRSDKILVAFSGGPDSVFALHFLNKFNRKYKIQITALHFNHGLRGKESDADEKFADEFCKKRNIPFISKKLNVRTFAKKYKFSVEEAARKLRYKHLKAVAIKLDCNKILTAHNQSDNTETVLMNLFTGTGLSGLSGIPVVRGNIIRPLICLSKPEIIEYLKKASIDYRIDSSNREDNYRRNFIRNQILPLIRSKINPRIDEAVLKSSSNLSGVLKINANLSDYLASKFVKKKGKSLEIDIRLSDLFAGEIAGEILKAVFKKYFNHQFEYDDAVKINSLINKQKGKHIQISKTISALKEENHILLQEVKKTLPERAELKVDSKVSIDAMEIGIDLIDNNKVKYGATGRVEFISADGLTRNFVLRRWKSGDRFKPLGMKNFKKVSDFLTDQKIPTSGREKQLVLLNRNQIVWIVGLRIDERVKLNSKTKKVYKIWVK